MSREVTFKNKKTGIAGVFLSVGDRLPDFRFVTQDMQETGISAYMNKTKVITSFPSLDTPVCDLQVKEFNEKSVAFSDSVAVIGISMDLPFAQKRFCQANDIKNLSVVSDYKYQSFCLSCGMLLKELNLAARSIMIVDQSDIIRYLQVVPEVTEQPDYNAAVEALQMLLEEGSGETRRSNEYDADAGGWTRGKDSMEKVFGFPDVESLVLWTRVLNVLLSDHSFDFTVDSAAKKSLVIVGQADSSRVIPLIDKIRV